MLNWIGTGTGLRVIAGIWLLRAVIAVLGLSAMLGPGAARPLDLPSISGPAKVVDGDTLHVGPVIVRIHGIDAPESGQICQAQGGGTWPCGVKATARMAALVQGGVECTAQTRDRYGRIVARCHAGATDIGEVLVREGLAWAFVRYSDDYAGAEDAARADKRGIWQAANQTAWDYRARSWDRAEAATPERDCPIKGNINSEGQRIYHTPWSKGYARTRINESKGERWFCNEAEAVAAGWRAARWH